MKRETRDSNASGLTRQKPRERQLPNGWRWVRLGNVVAEVQSGFACGERDPDGVIQLRMNNVDTRGNFVWDEFIRVPADEDAVRHYKLEPGDVLFNNTNSVELVGKSALFTGYSELVVYSNHFTRLRTDRTFLLPDILAAWLNLQWHCGVFANICNRWVGQSAVKPDKLLSLDFPLPPLDEQKRLAATLNEQMAAVKRARKAAEERLEAVEALPAAFLRKVFPRPGEPLADGWRWVRLDEVCEEHTGVRDPRKEPDKSFRYVDITSVDCKTKRIVEAKTLVGEDAPSRARQVIRSADVIVSTTRPNLNAVALVPPELDNEICSTGFCVLRAKADLHPDYLFMFVQTAAFFESLSELVKGALYPAVTNKQVRDQMIPLPPLAEQKRLAAILNEQMAAVERARKAAEEVLETINAMPAALLRRAFNGEL